MKEKSKKFFRRKDIMYAARIFLSLFFVHCYFIGLIKFLENIKQIHYFYLKHLNH